MIQKLSKHLVLISFTLSFVMVAFAFAAAILYLSKIEQPLIIHFSQENGIDKIGNLKSIWGLGIFGLFLISLNSFLAYCLEKKDKFLSRVILSSNLFYSFLIFLLFLVIISVN